MEVISNNISLSFVKGIQDSMQEHKFMLCYRGSFSHSMIKSILSISEKKMDFESTDISIKKKVFNVMVECLQNVCKNDEYSEGKNAAMFMLGKNKHEFVIYSGNVIENDKIEELNKNLVSISAMNKQELKDYYLLQLSNNQISDNFSIILGLIDVAKKTGNKLDYSFTKIDESKSFFSLNTSISNQN
jgi:hypothetical protein